MKIKFDKCADLRLSSFLQVADKIEYVSIVYYGNITFCPLVIIINLFAIGIIFEEI